MARNALRQLASLRWMVSAFVAALAAAPSPICAMRMDARLARVAEPASEEGNRITGKRHREVEDDSSGVDEWVELDRMLEVEAYEDEHDEEDEEDEDIESDIRSDSGDLTQSDAVIDTDGVTEWLEYGDAANEVRGRFNWARLSIGSFDVSEEDFMKNLNGGDDSEEPDAVKPEATKPEAAKFETREGEASLARRDSGESAAGETAHSESRDAVASPASDDGAARDINSTLGNVKPEAEVRLPVAKAVFSADADATASAAIVNCQDGPAISPAAVAPDAFSADATQRQRRVSPKRPLKREGGADAVAAAAQRRVYAWVMDTEIPRSLRRYLWTEDMSAQFRALDAALGSNIEPEAMQEVSAFLAEHAGQPTLPEEAVEVLKSPSTYAFMSAGVLAPCFAIQHMDMAEADKVPTEFGMGWSAGRLCDDSSTANECFVGFTFDEPVVVNCVKLEQDRAAQTSLN